MVSLFLWINIPGRLPKLPANVCNTDRGNFNDLIVHNPVCCHCKCRSFGADFDGVDLIGYTKSVKVNSILPTIRIRQLTPRNTKTSNTELGKENKKEGDSHDSPFMVMSFFCHGERYCYDEEA